MRSCLSILIGILTILSCSKEHESEPIVVCSINSESFYNNEEASLSIKTQSWVIDKNDTSGFIHLNLVGVIVGDSAIIKTDCDSKIVESEIKFDSGWEFQKVISIYPSISSLPKGDFNKKFTIIIYSENDTLNVALESCLLRF